MASETFSTVMIYATSWRQWAALLRHNAEQLEMQSLEALHHGICTLRQDLFAKDGETGQKVILYASAGETNKTPLQIVHLASAKRTLADFLLRAVGYAEARVDHDGKNEDWEREMRHILYQIMHWMEPAHGLAIPEQWLVDYARNLQTQDPMRP